MQGKVSEEKIDSFNLPNYYPTLQQMKGILQKNQSFSIERAEMIHNPGKYTLTSPEARAAFYRAVHEELLTQHFGPQIIDELFHLFADKLALSPVFRNPDNDKSLLFLLLLKRNKY